MKNLFLLMLCFICTTSFTQTTLWSTGFETGNSTPTYSLTTGVSLGLSTTGGNNAAYSGRIVANSGSAGKVYDGSIITNNTISVTSGKYYEVIVWAKIATATGKLQIYKNSTNTNAAMKTSSGGDIILSSSTNNVTSTSYVKYSVGFTVSSNETKYIGFQMNQTATASANMFLDDIQIIEYNEPQCIHYCKPTSSGSTAGHITNVTFNTISRNSTYDGYVCTGVGTAMQQSSTHNLSITKTTTYPASITAWIDYNDNGTFESGEDVATFASNSTATQNTNITIPGDATAGNTKMRVMFKYNAAASGPCDDASTYYDVEDYDIEITAQPACSGTPTPGNTISSSNPVCPNGNITLSLQNSTSGSGVTYQWQSSTNNTSWTNESGTSSTFNVNVISNKYYRCVVTCSGSSGTSNSVYVTVSLSPSCYGEITSTTDDATGLTEVMFNTITNPTTGAPAYTDFTGTINTTITQGGTYQLSVKVNTNGNYTVYAKAWVDWNKDGVFSSSTEEYNLGSVKNVTNALTNLSPLTIDVPINANAGETFMRIRATYNVAPTSSGNQNYSEAEDYKIIIEEPTPLPVELIQFEGVSYPQWNVIKWATASEHNSSHYDLQLSLDGVNWRTVITKPAAGNSTEEIRYSYIDWNQKEISYYKLIQYDNDGKYEEYGPISISRLITEKTLVKCINLMGQEINPLTTTGLVIEIYSDGSIKKMIR